MISGFFPAWISFASSSTEIEKHSPGAIAGQIGDILTDRPAPALVGNEKAREARNNHEKVFLVGRNATSWFASIIFVLAVFRQGIQGLSAHVALAVDHPGGVILYPGFVADRGLPRSCARRSCTRYREGGCAELPKSSFCSAQWGHQEAP